MLAAAAVLLLCVAAIVVLVVAGSDTRIRAADGSLLRARLLAAGGAHACAAEGAGVWCWGAPLHLTPNRAAGSQFDRHATAVAVPAPVTAIASGLLHSCVLVESGAALCWGVNFAGQLGVGGVEDRSAPTPVALSAPLAAVSSLGRHTCALGADGSLFCWGDDSDGQLGVGRPVASCGIDRISFYCADRPERVGSPGQWRAVGAGGGHTCAIDAAGSLLCWGSNRYGQLGAQAAEQCAGHGGAAPCRRLPGAVAGAPERVAAVAAGASHTCVLDEDGRVYCWGLNRGGQTGSDTVAVVAMPTAVDTRLRFTALAAGAYHTCGVAVDGALYCWGSDDGGALNGRGRERCADSRCATRPVKLASGVHDVSAGFALTCSRRGDGYVRCWGDGEPVADGDTARLRPPGFASRVVRAGRTAFSAAHRIIYRTVIHPLEGVF